MKLTFAGRHHSEESKLKISLANKGKPKDKGKLNMNGLLLGHLWNKGKSGVYSEETIALMKAARAKQIISLKTRKKMRDSHLAIREKHWNWKGGIIRLHKTEKYLARRTMEYRIWREAVFKRDNYICVFCSYDRGGILEADHIKSWALYPELRFVVENGRTLCHDCHVKTETYGNGKAK